MTIIERIQTILEDKHRTAYQLCESIGIPHTTFTSWKGRKTDPPAKLIKPISDFLGVSTCYLLTGIEDDSVKLTASEAMLLDTYSDMTANAQKRLLKYSIELLDSCKNLRMR